MSDKLTVTVGTNLHDDLVAVADAWERAERGEDVRHHVLSFESWASLAAVLTDERVRLLRHLRVHPARSIRALAGELGRDYRNVHADVVALESAGLIERDGTTLRAPHSEIRFALRLDEPAAAA